MPNMLFKLLTFVAAISLGTFLCPTSFAADGPESVNDSLSLADVQSVLFLFDCSHGMRLKVSSESQSTKMKEGKDIIFQALQILPRAMKVGLRVFGQTAAEIQEVDCRTTELVVPINTGTRDMIFNQMLRMHPAGWNPLEYSLRKSIEDFKDPDSKSALILITDGADTCGGHPAESLTSLRAERTSLPTIIVIALTKNQDSLNQLRSVAKIGRGKFYDGDTYKTFLVDLKCLYSK